MGFAAALGHAETGLERTAASRKASASERLYDIGIHYHQLSRLAEAAQALRFASEKRPITTRLAPFGPMLSRTQRTREGVWCVRTSPPAQRKRYRVDALLRTRSARRAPGRGLSLCDALLSTDATDAATWCSKGEALRALGSYRALSAYNESLKIKANDAKTLVGKASCLILMRRYKRLVSFG